MFLQYAPAGAVLPLYSFQLHALGFGPLEMAWCCATQAMASIVGPVVAGQIADRWIPAERCLSFCAFLCGGLLLLLAELTTPLPVFIVTLLFWMLMCPVFTLGTSICFTHLPRPDRDYGPARMWGTVGWVGAAWFLGYWYFDPDWLCQCVAALRPDCPQHHRTDAYRLGSLLAFALAAYALTLPRTAPQRQPAHWLAPLEATRLLRRRPFAVYFLCIFGTSLTTAFTSQVTPLLLRHHGVTEAWLPLALTVAQLLEAASLLLLPRMLLGLGLRGTMLLGLGSWLSALVILTIGKPLGVVIASQLLNGLYISSYVVAGQVFLNRHAHGAIRVSAQALLVCVTGTGFLLGNLLVGAVRWLTDGDFTATFGVAAGLTVLLLIGFSAGFREENSPPRMRRAPREDREGTAASKPEKAGMSVLISLLSPRPRQ